MEKPKGSDESFSNILRTILSDNLNKFLMMDNVKQHIDDDSPYTINVPTELSFVIYFLMTFSVMVAGPN